MNSFLKPAALLAFALGTFTATAQITPTTPPTQTPAAPTRTAGEGVSRDQSGQQMSKTATMQPVSPTGQGYQDQYNSGTRNGGVQPVTSPTQAPIYNNNGLKGTQANPTTVPTLPGTPATLPATSPTTPPRPKQ